MEKVVQLIRCPRCGKSTVWQNNPDRPFCSEKCREVDLGRWANEDYSIPGPEVQPEEDNPEF
ncbi:DNA gyrase inhibitor YacG [Geopsychrobacter electrodiphilus]|uniref:DNA gyrase inhibitor YacG n=1 Tax=Geopsychrobacter electrodiphilus TaxID=225196 RepID=UPI0003AA3395|nr:DNA gyrase inhibitor YacG [Geopsychrobacter electrodiphilus]